MGFAVLACAVVVACQFHAQPALPHQAVSHQSSPSATSPAAVTRGKSPASATTSSPPVAPSAASSVAPHPAASTSSQVVHPITPTGLVIPALGVGTLRHPVPVKGMPSSDDTYGIPPNFTQVGWWNGYRNHGEFVSAPKPGGQPGNANIAVFIAHTGLDDKSGVFAHLGELKPGNRVYIFGIDRQGHRGYLTLRVLGESPAKKSNTQALNDAIDAAPAATRAAFITCSGKIDWSIGHHEYNTVMFADIRSWQPN